MSAALSRLPGCMQGTAAVAAVLTSNHSIYNLSLAGCPLRDEGAMALAEALRSNISLYKLDLSNCLVRQGTERSLFVGGRA